MKIGIIHFNNTHLREASEDHTIEYKQDKIFFSLKNRLAEFEQVFILNSESNMFSVGGEADEQVKSFYRNIKADLGLFSNREVKIVGAPWDQNYHFENVECGWKYIIEGLEKQKIREKNHSLLVECCTPLMEDGPTLNSKEHAENWQRKASNGELEKFMNIYGESGSLLDLENPNKSNFSMLSFDLEKTKICVSSFNYAKGTYREKRVASDHDLLDFNSKGERRYSLSKSFSAHLESLDAEFLDRGDEQCKADLLCVNPFLKFIDPKTNKLNIGRFNKLLEGGKLDKAILIGDGGAGKTFLSNKLFKHFHGQTFTPILIKGSEILKPDSEFIFDTLIRKAFERHYLAKEHKHFGAIDKNKLVLIIDDFNGCLLKSQYRNQFVKNLNAQVEKTIFCSNSIMFFSSIDPGELADFQTYNLVEYSFKLGSNLIGK